MCRGGLIVKPMLKRIVDILLSGIAMVILAPLFVLLAVAIRVDSRGPSLFRQERVGLGGRTFRILKFRTMVEDAEHVGSFQTVPGDQRVTRLGKWLRRSSLDELPQLLNVLRGEMSLVGPRPDVPAQREFYESDEWTLRHRVRPGLTGWVQATLRSSATWEQRKRLELRYVQEQCLALDLKIIFLTLKQVFRKGGY